MSINNNINKTLQDGNGTQTAFTFSFKIFKDTDLKVYKVTKSTGALGDLLVLNTDYTVSINKVGEGGTVTFTVAPTAAQQAYIYRDISIIQPAKIPVDTEYVEKTLEDALDRACMISQQLKEIVDRCIKFSGNLDLSGLVVDLPTPAPDHLIKWNSAGTGFENFAADTQTLEYVTTRLYENLDNIDAVANMINYVLSIGEELDNPDSVFNHLNSLSLNSGYPRFCVNSGSVDGSGEPNFVTQSGNTITASAPFTYTTAGGITRNVTSNLTLDISDYSPGTYRIFVDYDEVYETHSLVMLDNVITKSKVAPSSPTAGDIWVNMSVYPRLAYKYRSGQWELTDYVPIAALIIAPEVPFEDELEDEDEPVPGI